MALTSRDPEWEFIVVKSAREQSGEQGCPDCEGDYRYIPISMILIRQYEIILLENIEDRMLTGGVPERCKAIATFDNRRLEEDCEFGANENAPCKRYERVKAPEYRYRRNAYD